MRHKVIELPLRCLAEPHRREACLEAIRRRLEAQPGMHKLTISLDDGNARIAMQYDPSQLTLAQIERDLRSLGACFDENIHYMVLPVEGIYSPVGEQLVESLLNRLPGVTARASYLSQSIRLEYDRRFCPFPQLASTLQRVGVRPRFDRALRSPVPLLQEPPPAESVAEPAAPPTERVEPTAAPAKGSPSRFLAWLQEHNELAMTLIGGLFLLAGFLVHLLDGPLPVRLALLAVSYICGGYHMAVETIRTLLHFRFNIDVMMFAAALGAASLGHYEEGALLLFLFGLGNAGEKLAMDRARSAIEALAKLAPEVATVREADGSQREVPVSELRVGDQVVLRPFERIAADGRVVQGASAVDQSPITGESVPVEKALGSDVFAGTINGEGMLVIEVTRPAGETTLARIITLVSEAQTTRSPTQTFTDQMERWYVPTVLGATALMIFVPPLAGLGTWSTWFYRAMAFLTAASPCALAIGTPATVLCGIARAARTGVLIKGGAHLENLGRVRAIAFDKTGTLTRGQPEVTDVVAITPEVNEQQVLALAAAVEHGSNHPLATAIVAAAQQRGVDFTPAQHVEQRAGEGIQGQIEGRTVTVGKPTLLPDNGERENVQRQIDALVAQAKTTVVVLRDGRCVGLIALADQPRENAAMVLRELKRVGVRRNVMLTGDNADVAAAISKQVGVDDYYASLLPEDKVTAVRELLRSEGHVAMVGDGVNDAPALATASVGIAMGGAGSDVALETADVALMADDLSKLPSAIALSRFSRRIILENLLIAMGVIVILSPIAALGYVPLGVAVVFHEGSTVVVVLNALRLLLWRDRTSRNRQRAGVSPLPLREGAL